VLERQVEGEAGHVIDCLTGQGDRETQLRAGEGEGTDPSRQRQGYRQGYRQLLPADVSDGWGCACRASSQSSGPRGS